ncbi:MAG: ankyrin repeat domain-containing protein [Nostoc sp. ChiSLP01]|nr:ankyrin repeat domain-containing protein [Nostoc sp. CmiSLP01]MDZ8284582.1 ankyrin repeat domain-containing protein [Nostoc sp. ChiSLP01]
MSGKDRPVHQLARCGDVQALKALLDRNPELALAKGWFDRLPIHCAAEAGAVECVQLLIERMQQARGLFGFVSRLSSQPAVIDLPDSLHAWTPLFEAVIKDSLDCARLLLEHGANPNARSTKGNRQETPLFHAKSLEMVLLLEEYGADLDAISYANQYAFEATGWRSLELLQFWLNRDVNVNHVPGFHSSLLHTAIDLREPDGGSISQTESVNLLLDYGANPNLPERYEGNTALHIAVLAKKSDIARLLLARGANPNAQNYIGDTPLHQATKHGEVELSQLLIEYGADVNIRNLHRRCAWDNAQEFPELLATVEPHWLNLPNPRPTPQQLIERILSIPEFGEAGLTPCSKQEIRHLEQKFGVILPEAYKEFLQVMGKWAGGFIATDHWNAFYESVKDMAQSDKFAQFENLPQLPHNYFVFASRLGSTNLFFVADGKDDDPPIYYFGDETEITLEKRYDSFWDWIEEMVIYYEYYNQKGVL